MSFTVVKQHGKFRAVIREKDEDNKWRQHMITLESTGIRAAKIEAEEKVAEYELQKEKEIIPAHSLVWLIREYIEKTSVTPKTKENYKSILETHIEPYFGSKKYAELTANDFSLYYKEKTEK